LGATQQIYEDGNNNDYKSYSALIDSQVNWQTISAPY